MRVEREERNSSEWLNLIFTGGKMEILKKVTLGAAKVVAVYVLLGFVLWLHGIEIVSSVSASGKAKTFQGKIVKGISKETEKWTRLGRKKIQAVMSAKSSNRAWQKLWKYI